MLVSDSGSLRNAKAKKMVRSFRIVSNNANS